MSELSQAIQEMRNMRESYDQIGAAAEAYNTGKTQLAQNITAKGVPASASENLPELAEKVAQIAQTETVIDGGEMYAAQMTGDGALWNLYAVLADMKSRFMGTDQYACLIVCEYYKGYDSLQLQGADAYYTCDGDFYDASSPLHTWHDSNNGKANRWVCFLFATEGARLDITNTAISPRSMYIGGHIGTIEYFVDGRLTELVCGVEETDSVDELLFDGHANEFLFNTTIKGIKKNFAGDYFNVTVTNYSRTIVANKGLLAIKAKDLISSPGDSTTPSIIADNCISVNITCDRYLCSSIGSLLRANAATDIYFHCKHVFMTYKGCIFNTSSNWQHLYTDIEDVTCITANPVTLQILNSYGNSNLILLSVGEMKTNLNIRNWNPTNVLADADKKAQLIENIKNHILARVSDATGGTQLVFTISTNMYNAIASENITWNDQTMTLADAFLTKNWLLAGA